MVVVGQVNSWVRLLIRSSVAPLLRQHLRGLETEASLGRWVLRTAERAYLVLYDPIDAMLNGVLHVLRLCQLLAGLAELVALDLPRSMGCHPDLPSKSRQAFQRLPNQSLGQSHHQACRHRYSY